MDNNVFIGGLAPGVRIATRYPKTLGRYFYSGPLTLVTVQDSQPMLMATPNTEILTFNGWQAIMKLHEGNKVYRISEVPPTKPIYEIVDSTFETLANIANLEIPVTKGAASSFTPDSPHSIWLRDIADLCRDETGECRVETISHIQTVNYSGDLYHVTADKGWYSAEGFLVHSPS